MRLILCALIIDTAQWIVSALTELVRIPKQFLFESFETISTWNHSPPNGLEKLPWTSTELRPQIISTNFVKKIIWCNLKGRRMFEFSNDWTLKMFEFSECSSKNIYPNFDQLRDCNLQFVSDWSNSLTQAARLDERVEEKNRSVGFINRARFHKQTEFQSLKANELILLID